MYVGHEPYFLEHPTRQNSMEDGHPTLTPSSFIPPSFFDTHTTYEPDSIQEAARQIAFDREQQATTHDTYDSLIQPSSPTTPPPSTPVSPSSADRTTVDHVLIDTQHADSRVPSYVFVNEAVPLMQYPNIFPTTNAQNNHMIIHQATYRLSSAQLEVRTTRKSENHH